MQIWYSNLINWVSVTNLTRNIKFGKRLEMNWCYLTRDTKFNKALNINREVKIYKQCKWNNMCNNIEMYKKKQNKF